MLRILHERAPGARILAEESGAQGDGEVCFIVDPLDGTTNYAHGIPIFCCTVGAEENGKVVAGCTVDPLRGETFLAARGHGAELRTAKGTRPLRVSQGCGARGSGGLHRLPLRRSRQAPADDRALRRIHRASAAGPAVWAAPRSTWPTSPRAGSTDSGRGASSPGTSPPECCWSKRPAAWSRASTAQPHRLAGGEVVAAPPALHPKMLHDPYFWALRSSRRFWRQASSS